MAVQAERAEGERGSGSLPAARAVLRAPPGSDKLETHQTGQTRHTRPDLTQPHHTTPHDTMPCHARPHQNPTRLGSPDTAEAQNPMSAARSSLW